MFLFIIKNIRMLFTNKIHKKLPKRKTWLGDGFQLSYRMVVVRRGGLSTLGRPMEQAAASRSAGRPWAAPDHLWSRDHNRPLQRLFVAAAGRLPCKWPPWTRCRLFACAGGHMATSSYFLSADNKLVPVLFFQRGVRQTKNYYITFTNKKTYVV